MTRRRLRVSSSSSDDDDDGFQSRHQQTQPPHIAADPLNPTIASEPVQISDDDFVDVSESFSPPLPPDPPPPQPATAQTRSTFRAASPIEDLLLRMGVKLRRQWLESCIQGLESSVPRFQTLDVSEKAKLCFEQFLFSDMNYSGAGVLPENVASMHLVDLKGPFVLQVDEIVNISSPLRGRYQDAAAGVKRCLKLCMTDGAQRVFGMEYRPVKDLKVLAPAGLKVAICNVHIRRGLLMLVPEAIEVLGGVVDELEAVRQRLVIEVNKPPRGKRMKAGAAPPLATRATAAAWPRDSANEQTNVAFPRIAEPLQAEQRGANLVSHTSSITRRTYWVGDVPNVGLNHALNPSSGAAAVEEMDIETVVGRESDASNVASVVEEVHLDRVISRQIDVSDVASVVEEMHIDSQPASVNREFSVSNLSTNLRLSTGRTGSLVDEDEPPVILSGSDEVPFTYLASLSFKLASTGEKFPSIRGKIKGFLTGVKSFQYRQRSTYELMCYVDDGSMISEIFIDHNVVRRIVGYSPEEVTAALSSEDRKTSMKETMTGFQKFLVNFEGTMLVELNRSSKIPVALEMTQGCTAADAWSLLRRLRPPIFSRTPERMPLAPIDISP